MPAPGTGVLSFGLVAIPVRIHTATKSETVSFHCCTTSAARISAGRALLLPSSTPETLLRRQSDGSYHLIVASFQSSTELRICPMPEEQRLSSQQKLRTIYCFIRVGIDGLKNSEEGNDIWLAGLKDEWFRFADNPEQNHIAGKATVNRR